MYSVNNFSIGIPPSVNKIWLRGKHGNYLAPKYKAWIGLESPKISTQNIITSNGHVVIDIHGGKGWRKGRDIDNALKAVLDLLVRCYIVADDNCQVVRSITVNYHEAASKKDVAYAHVFVEGKCD